MPAKTRNSDRSTGKAWGKNHNASVKPLSVEAQTRKAHKNVESKKQQLVSSERGSKFTMPNFTWEWATQTMIGGRITSTRRFRMVEVCLEQERKGVKP